MELPVQSCIATENLKFPFCCKTLVSLAVLLTFKRQTVIGTKAVYFRLSYEIIVMKVCKELCRLQKLNGMMCQVNYFLTMFDGPELFEFFDLRNYKKATGTTVSKYLPLEEKRLYL